MQRLAGKRVIVTGGSTGIGAAIAKRFLDEGAKVCIWCRNPDNAAKIKAELPALSDVICADVAEPGEVDAAFARSVAALGGLDVMIPNAGISIRKDFLNIDRADFDRVMRVNVHGVFYPSQLAARHMMKADGGAIVITASTAGVVGYRHYSDYNASKGAVLAMMRTMAIELAPKVRVNAVNPGYTSTPMQDAEYSPEMLKRVNDIIPMRRHGRPEELAGLYVYLASDEAAYATGGIFTFDGAESVGSAATTL
ncbi:SDR family NAD(P)-dependent oxidoreductase [Aestuariivirga litoralis]|uniref:SDR family NAD(P)-dependent oxidoreductase n=1 Tax=Aestuariivirga litoralis TaxID=2650924 RepID=UPI0018C72F63|nr:SDR family oxidoreductase [Aestuariivirga litoralis]MBG1232646.1 SDR family oxidoreductase [Aestuariivirga litoralis]